MPTTTPSRCDRILALIDECLDAVAALADAHDDIRADNEQEGGGCHEHS